MTAKTTNDIYITAISNGLISAIATSIVLYDKICEKIKEFKCVERWGAIDYLIVCSTTNDKKTFVGFLSFENTLAHSEVVKNLNEMEFLGLKIKVVENTMPTTIEQKAKNRHNFKKNINNRDKILNDNKKYLAEISSKKRKLETEDSVKIKKLKTDEVSLKQTEEKAIQTEYDENKQLREEINTLRLKIKQLEHENEEFKKREEAAKILFRLSKE